MKSGTMLFSSYGALIWTAMVYQLMVSSTEQNNDKTSLPSPVNQTKDSMQTPNSNLTTLRTPSSTRLNIPEATDGPVTINPQTLAMKTGTMGIVAGVSALLIIPLVTVIIIFKQRGNAREERTDVATGSVNLTLKESDVTPESTYEIASPPRVVKPNPKDCHVTTVPVYDVPRCPANKNHQFTRDQSSNGTAHYVNTPLSIIQNYRQ